MLDIIYNADISPRAKPMGKIPTLARYHALMGLKPLGRHITLANSLLKDVTCKCPTCNGAGLYGTYVLGWLACPESVERLQIGSISCFCRNAQRIMSEGIYEGIPTQLKHCPLPHQLKYQANPWRSFTRAAVHPCNKEIYGFPWRPVAQSAPGVCRHRLDMRSSRT